MEQTTDSTSSAGSSNAAEIKVGADRSHVDVFYDISTANGDIVVEVSKTGDFSGEEHERTRVTSGSAVTGGDWPFNDTLSYTYVRVYGTSGFSDSDINTIEVSA